MARRFRRAAAVLAVLMVAAPPAAAVASDSSAAAAELAARYAPVVRLVTQETPCGAGEPYKPMPADVVLNTDQVALEGPWQSQLVKVAPTGDDLAAGLPGYHLNFPGDALRPGCSYERWQRLVSATHRPTTYAHIASEQGQTALQFWFFYVYNDYNNKHEGDWETIQLDFPAADAEAALRTSPTEVGYSQHNGAERAAWGDAKLQRVDGTHPVVYPAEGSHANYFQPALYLGSSAAEGVGCDNTRGPWQELNPVVNVIPSDPAAIRTEDPWLLYRGHWGEAHPAFYNGPTGPAMHSQWVRPITWAQTSWHPTAFAIPGGVDHVPDATTVFCGAIAKGSSLLTLTVQGGPVVFLAALAAIVVLLLGLVRVDWRPSQPYALARRRTLGQITTASARMYRHNPRLYLTIGAGFLPVWVAIGLLQRLMFWLSDLDVLSQVAGQTNAFLVTAAVGIWLLFSLMALTVVQAMVAYTMPRTGDQAVVTARAAYAGIRPFIRPLTAGLVVVSASVLLLQLTIVGIPVAVWLVMRWSLFAQCIVIEGLGWRAALRRSARLVRHRWLRVAWVTLVVVGVALMLGPAIGVALILVSPLGLGAVNLVSALVSVLAVPYAAIATCYLYYDLRTREITDRQPESLPAEAVLS
jgi:Vacuolar protein sorting-associated protein 62